MTSTASPAQSQDDAPAVPLTISSWKNISPLSDKHVYPTGVDLFCQDSTSSDVYFLETGIVKLMRCEANGRVLILGLRFSGSLLGAAAAIHFRPHGFSAVTVTRCELRRMSARVFLDLIASDTRVSSCLNNMLSEEILDHASHVSQIVCLPARLRLEQFLWQLSTAPELDQHLSPKCRFQLPLRQWEAAQLLAVTPTYLCRLLGELEQENIITRSNGWIIIQKPQDLWHETKK